MSHSSPRRPRRLTETLILVALGMSAFFFWGNWKQTTHHRMLGGEALAASSDAQTGAPPRPAPIVKAKPAERAAAIKTIRAQLHAFDVGNWKEAVKYQSAGLKGNFSSPAAFGAMITSQYPAFVHARRVDFGEANKQGAALEIPVRLTARDGQVVMVFYALVKEAGQYRIAGVGGGATEPPPGQSDNPPDETDGGLAV